jgi:hypothetical protein
MNLTLVKESIASKWLLGNAVISTLFTYLSNMRLIDSLFLYSVTLIVFESVNDA